MTKDDSQQKTASELIEWYRVFEKQVDALRMKDNGSLIGKYFIIREGKILDHYDTFETAYKVCLERYDGERFLIQQLLPENYNNFVFAAS